MPTILLVDDDPKVLTVLERVLRQPGRVFVATTDPLEAIGVLRRERLDLVICDQHMQHMDGAELLQEAKAIAPLAMRMILTGNVSVENTIAAINLGGVCYFVAKPWQNEELRTVVENALARAELARENERLTDQARRQNEQLREANRHLEERVAARTRDLIAKNRQLKTANDNLVRAQATLIHEKSMAAIGRLAGGIAHELNNPLAGVLGYAELLMADGHGAEVTEQAAQILEEGSRCQHIVENLLHFARHCPSERSLVYLPDVVRDCFSLLKYELRHNGIEVAMRCADDLPPTYADLWQLQQVLLSVLENACLSLAEVDGERRIDVKVDLDPAGQMRIQVADTGTGIAEEIVDRIFDPFFTTRDVGQGTGLGLSIAYGIVREHGGEIYPARDVQRGAKIVIVLPVLDTEDAAAFADRDATVVLSALALS